MSNQRWIDDSLRKHHFSRSLAVACMAVLVLNGCGRQPSPNAATDQRKAATSAPSADTTKAAPSETAVKKRLSDVPSSPPPTSQPESGQQLYARHCAACHGERGDGKGLAAAFLFPKPRDFRAGRFRLVSTKNNVPTREDLNAVLLRGMPGSVMPPWTHLTQRDRDALVDEVLRIRRDGARESYIQKIKEEEQLTDKEIAAAGVQKEIQDYVNEMTTPGESTKVPDIQAPTDEVVKRGREVYAKYACIQCHGETGRGDGQQQMVDDEKMPTRPRDFTLGVFKGNPEPASLYRRVAYGMPGTPMPGSSTMTPQQMTDLVHYVRSLSTEEQRQAAVLKRAKLVAGAVEHIPESELADAWSKAEPVHLRVAPLWWRSDADPDVTVQALHDDQNIAVRLTWRDETHDEHALRTESFKDAVAMELYRGDAEPFLGMGGPQSPVDVWFWDADRQNGEIAAEGNYPNAVVDVYPFSESSVASPDLSRHGARMADQPDVSLPARASGNLIVPTRKQTGGSSLHVGGPGSVTFRMPKNQLVRAHGTWSNGRWNVIMTRPLSVASKEDGVALAPGDRASVAFAVWDGSHRDRDGQKLITVWQDLELERN